MLKLISALFFASAALSQQGAKPAAVSPVLSSVHVDSNAVYASPGGRDLHADLYIPKGGASPFPAVIFIHGGGWYTSTKSEPGLVRFSGYMAEHGFVIASIEYRLVPEGAYPASLYDSKAAVRWLRANAAKYKIDPDRIGALGGSAGGELAGLLGTTVDLPRFEGHERNPGVSSRISAMALLNPAVDLADLAKNPRLTGMLVNYLGCAYAQNPKLYREASPTYHVNSKSVPAIFVQGDADTTVPYHQSVEMMGKLKAAGVHAELFTGHGANHGFPLTPAWFDRVAPRLLNFFISTLKGPRLSAGSGAIEGASN